MSQIERVGLNGTLSNEKKWVHLSYQNDKGVHNFERGLCLLFQIAKVIQEDVGKDALTFWK